ncbi:MAG TPA: M12 family metallo-peptidase, partial [Phycisphaerales bacterium]|nr:M12 family metallo-peptidase [Phycisphaerales bacterium]
HILGDLAGDGRRRALQHDVDAVGGGLAEAGGGEGGVRNGPCRVVRVAIDSDFEYTSWLFGGNADASAAYVLTLMSAVSEIFTYELNVRLVVPYVRVFTQDDDPYGGGDRLGELLNHWRATKGGVQRDLAHLFSGNFGGGVAYVSVMCSKDWGYAVSGVGGWFPYPLQDHHSGNWDPFVVAHELGHNFGTLHTHDGYDPPIDNCGNGDCSQAWGGTIMSYCHGCAGGMTNIVLRFGPLVIDRILDYLQFQAPCNLTNRVVAVDDAVTAIKDAATRLDVLRNDIPLNCDGIVLSTVQSVSDAGGTVSISSGTGEGGRDEVIYQPPQGFSGADRFEYFIFREGAGYDLGEVQVGVIEPRPADAPGVTAPGSAVAYYVIPPSSSMPDYSALEPYKRDIVPNIDYPATSGQFATSGRSNFVGAAFEGYFKAPETGLYVLSVESDDGSMLYLGDSLLVNNDGQHAMQERSAPAALAAGLHRLRVEFFENSGSAGLIVRAEGPGLPRQPIPASRWRHDDCVADWTRDGLVNSIDFIGFLADWSAQNPRADLNDDGTVSTLDFLAYLNAYAAGCP